MITIEMYNNDKCLPVPDFTPVTCSDDFEQLLGEPIVNAHHFKWFDVGGIRILTTATNT